MAKKEEKLVVIRPLKLKEVPVRIIGDTPLIVHKWSEKAKKEMLDAQTKKGKRAVQKEPRAPFKEFVDACYWLTEQPENITPQEFQKAIDNGAKFGFPVNAIKLASNSAAYRMGWVPNQMGLRGSYFLKSEYGSLAEIKGSSPTMREDMVKIGKGSADLRYRPEFDSWYMDFVLQYNDSGEYSLEDIINCINAGGYVSGIGEWRPEKDGDFGRFHVQLID